MGKVEDLDNLHRAQEETQKASTWVQLVEAAQRFNQIANILSSPKEELPADKSTQTTQET